jgi:outer membrane lipoprotein LolB
VSRWLAWRWWLVSLVMALAACASPPRLPGEPPWTAGRLSLRVQATADQPERSFSAAFELRGDSSRGELNINSPLGTRLVAAHWTPALARLTSTQGEQDYPSLDALSRQALGEALPLAALPDWLAGRPWAQAAHSPTTTGFDQLGWSIDLSRQAEGWITARRESAPTVLLRVRLDAAPASGAQP